MERQIIRYGMVGGDRGAFIGNVHRVAIGFDSRAVLTAGCFSSNPQKNADTAAYYRMDTGRVYRDYREMAEKEGARADGIDFVVIVTPNHLHYEIAKEFLLHGINVMCEKPLCFETEQAKELEEIAKQKNLLFAVCYTYSGNAMVKYAKELIAGGEIGDIIHVSGEYLQDWLIDELGDSSATSKLPVWRTNPAFSGIANCVGDIGTHIENTVAYMTGLKIKRVAARLADFGHALDLHASILVEYENGAGGVYTCSQVSIGHLNSLSVRIFGTKGAVEWFQESPNELRVTLKGKPSQTYSRGAGYVAGRAAEFSALPAGHPEGYYEAFANVYKAFIAAVAKKKDSGAFSQSDFDFPPVQSGIDGVKFIHAVVESGKHDAQWVTIEQ